KWLEAKGLGEDYRKELEQQQFLATDQQRAAALRIGLPAMLFVGGLGVYKFAIAISRGRHNVVFLIIMTIVALIILAKLSAPKRVTHLGRAYLERLQHALDLLKRRIHLLASGESSDEFLLAVAVFGIGALAGTAYGYYPEMFQRAARQAASGCGT